ncbi:MAG: hypothetical protein ABI995_02350 [Acidobacteriota bacterium]
MYACIYGPDAVRIAESFSPWVESNDKGTESAGEQTAVLRVTPRQLSGLRAAAQENSVRAAVAASIEAAMLAARNLPGYTFIRLGDEARVLGELSIDALPPDAEIFQTFEMWGIHTLGDLARLPERELASRLGHRGTHLQRLARGAMERPLKPLLPPASYEESADLEYPIKLREPLLFLIARFLHDLAAQLKAQSLAAQAVRLTLNREERTLSLPFPTRDVKLLLKLIEHSLERQPVDAPIARVHLELVPVQPRRVQHGLFTPSAPEPEKLELTLGKIRGLVGQQNVLRPELEDTYRPGAGLPTHFLPTLALRCFRPPLAARVQMESGVPKRLYTQMFQGRIVQVAGPWRSSGDWWIPEAWSRDEYDLLLSDGALYRMYRDRGLGAWFVEGVYD